MSVVEFIVNEDLLDARLDLALFKLVEEIPSRNFASKLIEAGAVQVNRKPVKASHKLRLADIIYIEDSFFESQGAEPLGESIPLSILFEDKDILVINKAAGMVVHPGAGVSSGTLVNAVLGYCGQTLPSLGLPARAGIVHRLDKDTSGVMVVAKSQLALTKLSEQFANHTQERLYEALVYEVPQPIQGTIETLHGRDPRNRLRFAVVPSGKEAVLNYAVQSTFRHGLFSEVQCKLHTGRTHQIRVQMAHVGCGLLGDALYAKVPQVVKNEKAIVARLQKLLTRQMLHAKLLGFAHPVTGDFVTFTCDAPTDYAAVREFLSSE